jgi:hypothetical protein
MANEFINLLRNEKLREEIINYLFNGCDDARALFNYEPDENDEEGKELMKNMDWQAAWDSISFCYETEKLFRKYFFDEISQPWPIQPEELTITLESMVCSEEFADKIADEEVGLENLYDVFLSYVENHFFSYRRSLPFTICKIRNKDTSFIKWFLIGRLEDENEMIKSTNEEFNTEYDKSKILWTKNDISVILEPRLDKRGKYQAKEGIPFREDEYSINVIVAGRISPASLGKVYSQISRCLPSIIRSFALLYPLEGTTFINFDYPPQVDEHFFENYGTHIGNCLELFFTEPTPEDSVERRIRNAVHLLVESDNQTIDGLSVAFSMETVEALLVQDSKDTSKELRKIAAALLEPDLSKQDKAEEFIKELWKKRCRALHGGKIEAEKDIRQKARHLAAATLVAVLNLRYYSKYGSEAEVLAELKKLYDKPEAGQPIGVPELNIRSLWTNKKD